MKSSEIRQAFLAYFQEKGHTNVPSSSLVPGNDPTLLFTNAGMVQFKDTFLGLEPRPYSRAVTAQRCLRAGGKHNDLENVGYTARHHTLFEMLGNFSFGDYFKREAIQFAWGFLTDVLHLPPEKLWITVYQDDDEAASIWLDEIGIDSTRFSRCGEADNFWSMGDTGPCGPCSEIFYDHGPNIPGGPPGSPDAEGDRYIEIWNLVFMQYNRDSQGHLHPLPKPSVDTGMGLERIAAVVQGVHNNYDIDSFSYLIQAIIKKTPGVDKEHPSLKVIADHIRACAFLIADGVMPSNEGRGYVLRRIIRRAVRHGNKLRLEPSFFSNLVVPLVEVMGEAYPALIAQSETIQQILLKEELQFAKTLEHGLHLLQHVLEKTSEAQEIPGEVVFKLYDTYGFPADLTADIAREHGLTVDEAGFEKHMQQQRAQSQSGSHFQVDYTSVEPLMDLVSQFKGYETNALETEVVQLLETGAVILAETPFYAESGGQAGDQGELLADGVCFRVDNTQQVGKAIIHYGELVRGELKQGDRVHAQINVRRRDAIRLNHTATHLLHKALKVILGEHVQQRGSLVEASRARFDFSHAQALTPVQWQQLEALVNEKIRANESVQTKLMSPEEAKAEGAVALFGEKYGQEVRVLSMGDFSKELCGGTHAKRTGDIGLFKITAEYGIASGVRRIDFVTGAAALAFVNQQIVLLDEVSSRLKTKPDQVLDKLTQVLSETRDQEKALLRLKTTMAVESGQVMRLEAKKLGDINLLVKKLDDTDPKALRMTLDQLKSSLENAVIVLFTQENDKLNVIAGVSKSILGRVPTASTLVRHLCGKGGGRDDMAQGGGDVPDDLDKKLALIEQMIAEHVS